MFIALVPGGFAEFSEKFRPDVVFLDLLHLEIGGGVTYDQCFETFYYSNLPSFHGNNILLCYKSKLHWKLPWNGSKLLQYFNPRKSRVNFTVVIVTGIVL
jgi:hypothetical protein